jgi:hypothetical protein
MTWPLPVPVGYGNTIVFAKLARNLYDCQQTIANDMTCSAPEVHFWYVCVRPCTGCQSGYTNSTDILNAEHSRFGAVAHQLRHQEGLRQGWVRQQQLQRGRLLVLLHIAHIVGLQQCISACSSCLLLHCSICLPHVSNTSEERKTFKQLSHL